LLSCGSILTALYSLLLCCRHEQFFKAGEIKDFTVNNYLGILKGSALFLCPKIRKVTIGLLKQKTFNGGFSEFEREAEIQLD